MPQPSYRMYQPGDGPAKQPADLAAWAVETLLGAAGQIVVHRRDLSALQETMLAGRVTVLPFGGPQPGTLWIAQ